MPVYLLEYVRSRKDKSYFLLFFLGPQVSFLQQMLALFLHGKPYIFLFSLVQVTLVLLSIQYGPLMKDAESLMTGKPQCREWDSNGGHRAEKTRDGKEHPKQTFRTGQVEMATGCVPCWKNSTSLSIQDHQALRKEQIVWCNCRVVGGDS